MKRTQKIIAHVPCCTQHSRFDCELIGPLQRVLVWLKGWSTSIQAFRHGFESGYANFLYRTFGPFPKRKQRIPFSTIDAHHFCTVAQEFPSH